MKVEMQPRLIVLKTQCLEKACYNETKITIGPRFNHEGGWNINGIGLLEFEFDGWAFIIEPWCVSDQYHDNGAREKEGIELEIEGINEQLFWDNAERHLMKHEEIFQESVSKYVGLKALTWERKVVLPTFGRTNSLRWVVEVEKL